TTGVIITGIYVWKKFGVIMSFPTLLRVTVATASFYIISRYIEASGPYLFLEYIFLSLVYLGALLVLGEIKDGDIKTIKETCYLSRKQPSTSAE
ncbi:MAG: hypothetical protein ACXADW_21350, partial [Candidatus Hodarchaeales archaeon]